jgi:hypothetical protein
MKLNRLAIIVAVAALACSALAQGGGGQRRGGGRGNPYAPTSLVRLEEVQKELNITDDQKTKLADLQASVQTKMTDLAASANGDRTAMTEGRAKINADAAKALGDILQPEQMKRLRELQIQWSGKSILATDKELQSTLSITDEQKTKIAELIAKQQAANQEASQGGDRQAAAEARTKNAKILEDEIDKVLTDAQKTKLKELGGKELAKPAPRPRGGGGGGL